MSNPIAPHAKVDLDRHGGRNAPRTSPPKPVLGDVINLDPAVIRALPVQIKGRVTAHQYGMSLWGQAAKILVPLPNGDIQHFFLKTVSVGQLGRTMVRSEFESLKAIRAVSPSLVPLPHAWGRYDCDLEVHFLLTEFREIGRQPPYPVDFTASLVDMHKRSMSPTGKFGFHTTTCHGTLPQMTDIWEGSCSVLYQKQLAHMIKLDQQRNGVLPEFQHACKLVVEKVIPRLLEPLQSSGRTIKPCLVHGDLWDENTATDVQTGQSFIFDAASFYAHNEYELGDWRANRHLLNDRIYVDQYKRDFPPSEPRSEWDDRNLLYSFRFDLGTLILIPGCPQRDIVHAGMIELCQKYFPKELATGQVEGASVETGDRNEGSNI